MWTEMLADQITSSSWSTRAADGSSLLRPSGFSLLEGDLQAWPTTPTGPPPTYAALGAQSGGQA